MCIASKEKKRGWKEEIRARGYSDDLVDLVRHLLRRRPANRPTMERVMAMPIVQQGATWTPKLRERLINTEHPDDTTELNDEQLDEPETSTWRNRQEMLRNRFEGW
mmetsp:Transcript_49189/g.106806  ORF Transcript_49189/g.106806 Transcript_49189/m.106806 type:complete len:106 (+) Transcript_49189:713-1030(+)